jgi:hypothetical protein
MADTKPTPTLDRTEFNLPDDEQSINPTAVNAGEKVEIEIIDDTPAEDKNRAPMKEPPPEVTDEELEQYSDSVKKRIQHFTKGYHEERRAKEAAEREKIEALKFAQKLVDENKQLQGSLGQGQTALLEQAKKVVENEITTAKQKLKIAHEAFDTDAIIAAQEELTAAKIKADRVSNFQPTLQPKENAVQTPSATPAQVDPKARAWQESNRWFGTDDEMTAVALTVHRKLVESGISPTSDEYYEKINSRVRQVFPDAFKDATSSETGTKATPSNTVVAPATRSTAPKKIVLTQTQVNLAKKLNVPLELYAKQVAELNRK